MLIPNRVIIWSSDNYNSLAMLRQVAQGEIKIDFLVHGKSSYTTKSKYIQRVIEKPSIEEAYIYLMSSYIDERVKPIILTSGDNIIAFIDDHRNEMSQYFIIPGTTEGLVRKYNDKFEMSCLANRIGIMVPESHCIQWNSPIDDVPIPCILKPSHQKKGKRNEFKFKICKDRKSLAKTMKYVDHESVFIAQQLVKKEKDLLVYGARMWDGKVVLAGSLETDRFAVGQGSSFGKVLPTIPKCIDPSKIEAFLEQIDYHGLFSFEYGLMNGKAYFFEVNMRNDGTSSFFFQAGANIPLAYVYSSAGKDYSSINTRVESEHYYMDELFDYANVIQHNVSRTTWKKERNEATVFKFFDPSDKEPYLAVKCSAKKRIIIDIIISHCRLYVVWLCRKMGIGLS